MISTLSFEDGRSTKKTSSSLPFRRSSGGREAMLFAGLGTVAVLVLCVIFTVIFFTRRKLAVKFLILLKPFKNKTFRKEIIAAYRLFHSHQHFPIQLGLAALATFGIELVYIYTNFLVARGMGFENAEFASFLLLIPLLSLYILDIVLKGWSAGYFSRSEKVPTRLNMDGTLDPRGDYLSLTRLILRFKRLTEKRLVTLVWKLEIAVGSLTLFLIMIAGLI